MSSTRTWLITGASTGFGYELAKVVASHGERVIATSRSPDRVVDIDGVVTARLDQNEPLEAVAAAIRVIVDRHGAPDVVVNNAAYLQTGTLEEASPEETLRQFRANVFGPLDVYRAVLPHLRAAAAGASGTDGEEKKKKPKLVTVGSLAAWFRFPGCNLYCASKAALRQVALGLADEVRPLGVEHMLVEPGYFRTDLLNPDTNMARAGPGEPEHGMGAGAGAGAEGRRRLLPEYAEMNRDLGQTLAAFHGSQRGDAARGMALLYEVITSSGRAEGRAMPSWLPLGSDAVDVISKEAERILKEVREWESLAVQTDFQSDSLEN